MRSVTKVERKRGKKEGKHREIFQLLCESRWRVKEADRLLQMAGAATKKALTPTVLWL